MNKPGTSPSENKAYKTALAALLEGAAGTTILNLLANATTFTSSVNSGPSDNPSFTTGEVTLPPGATRMLVICTASAEMDGPAGNNRFNYFLFRDTSATPIGPGIPIGGGMLAASANTSLANAALVTIDEGPIPPGPHAYGMQAQTDDSMAFSLPAQQVQITLIPLP
jgi:hypothetical protein